MKSRDGQIGSPREEKPLPGEPSAPTAASDCSESEDLLKSLTPPQRSPSPGCSDNPKPESEPEPCGVADQQSLHPGGVTPKPEVCLVCVRLPVILRVKACVVNFF